VGHDWMLWTLVTASAVHVVEERGMGWQGWAATTLGPRLGAIPTWLDFWATNMLLVVFGVSAASVGWRAPGFALAFPALCLIDAVLFHAGPSLLAWRPNPGLFTALALYLPLGIWAYAAAGGDGHLGAVNVILSAVIGAGVMASALVLLVLSHRFHYADVDALATEEDEETADFPVS
jgi:Protein of unknown function with HXXEE motif